MQLHLLQHLPLHALADNPFWAQITALFKICPQAFFSIFHTLNWTLDNVWHMHTRATQTGPILLSSSMACLWKWRPNQEDSGVMCPHLTHPLWAKILGRGYANLLPEQIEMCLWHSIPAHTHHILKKKKVFHPFSQISVVKGGPLLITPWGFFSLCYPIPHSHLRHQDRWKQNRDEQFFPWYSNFKSNTHFAVL